MNSENKTCQNCKTDFTIEPEDFDFYEKMRVQAPTFCPSCRLQRRLAFRNERSLYRTSCALCGQSIVTMYDPEGGILSYCGACWWSDKWDPFEHGQDYDFSRPFFEQLWELSKKVPHQNLLGIHNTWINTEFINMAHQMKNCYWTFNSDYDENCIYVEEAEHSKDCVDATMIDNSEFVYGSLNCNKCHKVFYSLNCENSHDIWFSKDLSGCSSCFGCVGLRNKQYCIFNEQFDKTEYEERFKIFDLASRKSVDEVKRKAAELWLGFSNKYIHGFQNTNASGDYIYHSKNVKDSYIVTESEDCKYCMWLIVGGNKDCYDWTQFGENGQRVYDTMGGGKGLNNAIGNLWTVEGHAIFYSTHCFSSCSDVFGCVGVRSKQYCILNKQYSKEEYEKLIPRIIQHMQDMPYVDTKGRTYVYGDFSPIELSEIAYNESSANEFFPLTREQAEASGFRWKPKKEKDYQVSLMPENIADSIHEVPDTITGEIIGCADKGMCNHQCTTAFRIIPAELQFYRRFNIPIPQLCPNCRHYRRVEQRNPIALRERNCNCTGAKSDNGAHVNASQHFHNDQECPNTFETTYAPDRPEIVYCEQCYNSEVA